LRCAQAKLEQRLGELEAAQAASAAKPSATASPAVTSVNHGTVVNGDVKVDASTHVVLNVWGGESFDHITPGRTREIVRALRTQLGGEDAEVRAVARYLPNVKGDRARVRTARGWEERASRDVEEAMHKTTVYVTGLKQPMETARDLKLMTPLLEELGEAPVARAGMRAALIEMRPERALRGQEAVAAARPAAREEGGAAAADEEEK
jgi:hypothetical protein